MKGQALGLVETYGYIGAMEAADVCLKAANVSLIGVEFVSGGLVTVKINGEVGAVKASVDAAKAAVEKVGFLVSTHVISRPSTEVSKMLDQDLAFRKVEEPDKAEPTERIEEKQIDEEEKAEEAMEKEGASEIVQKLKTMKVVEMRSFARELVGIKMERNHIKFAKREELLKAILDYYGMDDMD